MAADRARNRDGVLGALLVRGSAYTLAAAFQLSVAVLVLPFLTRLLSQAEFGKAATALVLGQVVTYLVVLGLPTAVTLEFFHRDRGLPAARALIILSAIVAVVLAGVLDLTRSLWGPALFDGAGHDAAFRLAVWSTVPTGVMLSVQALLRAQGRPRPFLAVAAIGTLGAQGLGVLFVAATHATAATYLVGVNAGLVAAAAAGIWFTGVDTSRLADRSLWRSALRLGIPTVPHAVAVYVVAIGDRILVQRIDGLDAVARYQVAYLVGALGLTLAGAVNNAWGPLVYGAGEERRWDVLAETTAALYRLASVVIVGVAMGAPVLLVALSPRAYDPAKLAPVAAIVALSLLPYLAYLANSHPLFLLRRVWSLGLVTPVSGAFNVVVNLIAIRHFHLVGAAVTTVATYALQAVLARRARARVVDIPWRPGAGRAWATATGAVVVGALAPTTGVWLGVRIVAGGAALVVFALRFRDLLPAVSPGADLDVLTTVPGEAS